MGLISRVSSRTYRYKMSVEGLQCDIEKLLTTFIENNENSVRFEAFSKVWRDLNMSRIVNGRVTHNDYTVLLEEAYRICLIFISSQYNEQVRIGSLYTLYSFYFCFNFTKPAETTQTQPSPFNNSINLKKKLTMHQYHRNCLPVQIRITNEYWRHLQTLLQWIRQNDHIDAEYIYKKLELSHAFVICASLVPASRTELWNSSRIHSSIRCGLPLVKYKNLDSSQVNSSSLVTQTVSLLPKFIDSTNTIKLTRVAEKYKNLVDTNLVASNNEFSSVLKGVDISEPIK